MKICSMTKNNWKVEHEEKKKKRRSNFHLFSYLQKCGFLHLELLLSLCDFYVIIDERFCSIYPYLKKSSSNVGNSRHSVDYGDSFSNAVQGRRMSPKAFSLSNKQMYSRIGSLQWC